MSHFQDVCDYVIITQPGLGFESHQFPNPCEVIQHTCRFGTASPADRWSISTNWISVTPIHQISKSYSETHWLKVLPTKMKT